MRANRERSRARGWALQVLYAADLRDADADEVLRDFLARRRIAEGARPYLARLVRAVDRHRDEIDEAITGALVNWRMDRLSAIDRNVLRIGAAELLHPGDVPPRVAIQEAIRLAERYGTAESPRFVNGVLDALYRRSEPGERGPRAETAV